MKILAKLFVSTLAFAVVAHADVAFCDEDATAPLKQNGARGDGVTDDTAAFQITVNQTKPGGRLLVPVGKYVISSAIVIKKPITIYGAGLGSQIYSPGNNALFQFMNVNGSAVRDLYLGSGGTQTTASLLEFFNSHHNEIVNVTMLGGYYGLHFWGSLLNTAIDIRSGTNFQGFFGATSINNTWVRLEPYNNISANANTFLAPALEGGVNGLVLVDGAGQGSVQILGGTIEGVSGVGLSLVGTFLPTSVTGIDFESNGQDIAINSSSNIKISAINSVPSQNTTNPEIVLTGDTRNIQIADSNITSLSADSSVKRVLLQNITFGTAGGAYCAYAMINLPAPTSTSLSLGSVNDPVVNVAAMNVGDYCGGQ